MFIRKSVFALSVCLLAGCAGPYKILTKENIVIESKNATYTNGGFAYQKPESGSWDTVKSQDVSFMAHGNLVTFVGPTGKSFTGEVNQIEFDSKSVCMQARLDAISGYPRPMGVYFGNAASGLLIGVLGIIPAAITASVPVSEHQVIIPDTGLLKNSYYKQCLMQQAQDIKSHMAWGGWVNGWTIGICITSIILSLSMLH